MDTPLSHSPAYAELLALSNYSFLQGGSHPEELVERAQAMAYAAITISDECSLAGVVRAHVRAKQIGMPLIIGSQCRMDPDHRANLGDTDRLLLLAMNREGYARLSQAISQARQQAPKGSYRWTKAQWDNGLPGCLAVWVPAVRFDHAEVRNRQSACPEGLRDLLDCFGERLYIGAVCHARGWDQAWTEQLQRWSDDTGVSITACGDVRFHRRSRRALTDVLHAIARGLSVAELGCCALPNAEAHLRSRLVLAQRYPAAWLEASVEIAEKCDFSLDSLRYEYPREIVPQGYHPNTYLRLLCEQGIAQRYPMGAPASVHKQIDHELALIEELQYEAYFLTVADIVQFARAQGILCQGRGSAANSAVCYVLGVTEVDPARMSVLFERFISRERREPPDIDIDFEHQRREEVIQYLYRKYGRDRAALTAAVFSWRLRSALREVGKALGFENSDIEQCLRAHRGLSRDSPQAIAFQEAGLQIEHFKVQQWMKLSEQLIGFPRHLSQHSGGFVIARDRLDAMVPIEPAAMPGRSVIQWDKDDLDALGLLKVDILALGMLSAIRRALDLISARDGRGFRMQDIPAEDPKTYAMISAGDTLGVFQIESRAQMAMLPRLKPQRFYDLVIEVAIVRPGPIQGGMVHPYLRRRQGLEKVVFPKEAIKPALERTLGVPIFQEQVMQIAILAAGFSPGEADQLRRAMAAWRRRGGLEMFQQRLIEGMQQRGYETEFAQQIFRQIEGFGEYGFPESHAASFALLVYVSCWIKCHEPAAFLAAMLNSQPLGFYAPAQLIQDARHHGVEVLAVDVLHSQWESKLERQADGSDAVRLGLHMVRGLSAAAGQAIERWQSGTHSRELACFASQTGLDQADLQALAKANALSPLSGHRRHSLWQVSGWQRQHHLLKMSEASALESPPKAIQAPDEFLNVAADLKHLGVSMGRHPMALLRPLLQRYRIRSAMDLRVLADGALARGSGIVTHRQRPETAKGVIFVTLEDETGVIQVLIYPDLVNRYRHAIFNAQLMTVYGRWQRDPHTEGQVTHLLAMRVEDHSAYLGVFQPKASRDFR
ncbi:MAG: DNA polymerase III subunit alpha [Betaproteobacteria bacterium]|nr:DNA polymerase III subunit alpha [Betaproteobacteria bacterium]NBP34183.1 DNA polymerase III subunit alpha [Betaproteobacteria bacterium]NBP37317.1 DNA polymerase III subunit alpha [Betaproteobacteria bacterium]NBQ77990.1 DNA polymerase III subunit alpha [Betaproteobacteria bacterium]NBQ95411.1 DNA polymerase III subunit alpha [Betaproteobacteria bacterium]